MKKKRKKEKNQNLKNWLSSNKIYFDTLCVTFLTIMAIIVSYYSYKTVKQQADDDELLNKPQMIVSYEFIGGEKTGYPDSIILIIENVGGRVNNYESIFMTDLKIDYSDTILRERNYLLISLYNYYTVKKTCPSKRDFSKLREYINLGNVDQYLYYPDLLENKLYNTTDLSVSLKKSLILKYTDYKNISYTEYYSIEFLQSEVEVLTKTDYNGCYDTLHRTGSVIPYPLYFLKNFSKVEPSDITWIVDRRKKRQKFIHDKKNSSNKKNKKYKKKRYDLYYKTY